MKQCPKCLTQVSDDDIVKHSYLCKSCTSENARWRHIKATYGLSKEDYFSLYESQGGKCAICGTTEEKHIKKFHLSIDHEHDDSRRIGTHDRSKIRGLLCNCCNAGVGQFRDNIELLRKAINYLETHTG